MNFAFAFAAKIAVRTEARFSFTATRGTCKASICTVWLTQRTVTW